MGPTSAGGAPEDVHQRFELHFHRLSQLAGHGKQLKLIVGLVYVSNGAARIASTSGRHQT